MQEDKGFNPLSGNESDRYAEAMVLLEKMIALKGLSETDRAIIDLRLKGYKLAEVYKELNIPEQTYQGKNGMGQKIKNILAKLLPESHDIYIKKKK